MNAIKTKHKDLLNVLDGMANSPTYCLRRGELRQAEQLILAQEQKINQLMEKLNEQTKKPIVQVCDGFVSMEPYC